MNGVTDLGKKSRVFGCFVMFLFLLKCWNPFFSKESGKIVV